MATTKKRYNFKGLDEIFGESVSDLVDNLEGDTKKARELSKEISINFIKPNPYQPRKLFDDESLAELTQSISQSGIIQPIIVNEIDEKNYQIVAGERRFRAAVKAGLKFVPVNIVRLDDKKLEEFALVENIQRVDLTDIEEAIAYKKLSQSLNLKQDEIANKVGKSRSHVANIMRLLNLPEYIQEGLLQKKLTMGQAKPLLSILSNKEFLKKIYERIVKEDLNSREVENLIKKFQSGVDEKKLVKKNYNLINIENVLMRKFGTRVIVDENKLQIKYKGVDDLNRILEILGYEYNE